jgi:hypothetical protein
MRRWFPLIVAAAGVQGGRSYDVAPVPTNVQSREVRETHDIVDDGTPTWVSKADVSTAPTCKGFDRARQLAVPGTELFEGKVAAMPVVDIKHHCTAQFASYQPDISIRPSMPPFVDDVRVRSGVLQTILRSRVFADVLAGLCPVTGTLDFERCMFRQTALGAGPLF